LHSELSQVKTAIQEVLSFLDDSAPSMSPDDRMDLRLVYSELLSNAVIHGNNYDLEKCVYLTAEFKGETLYSSIRDEGPGFNYDSVVNAPRQADIYDENGRGVMLAASLTDSFGYNRKGNLIYFYKRVKKSE